MAKEITMKKLTWVEVALGIWLIGSPLLLGYAASRPSVVAENLIPGMFLIASSGWMLARNAGRLRGDWLQELCGLWLIIGSVVLTVVHLPHAALNVLIVGLLVVAVDLIDMWTLTKQPSML
jgi:SPW repeat-containing protein